MKRKAIVLALVISMISTCTPVMSSAATTSYNDVKTGSWYAAYVDDVTDKGLMNGTGNNNFSPEDHFTRGMFMVTLLRMSGQTGDASASSVFKDVKAGSWYEAAIGWGVKMGITNGLSADTFGPDSYISRQDIALMVYRYCKAMNLTLADNAKVTGFVDSAQVSDYAKEAVEFCRAKGLIYGNTDGTYAPKVLVTRAEAAAILSRMIIVINGGTGTDQGQTTPEATTHTVTWLDANGNVLYTMTDVAKGVTPDLPSSVKTPTKSGYTFTGWTYTTNADGSVTATPVFKAKSSGGGGGGGSSSISYYTVTWMNWDGSVLETDSSVASGSNPSYDSAVPTRTGYTFAGWSTSKTGTATAASNLSKVYSNTTYYAIFTRDVIWVGTSAAANGSQNSDKAWDAADAAKPSGCELYGFITEADGLDKIITDRNGLANDGTVYYAVYTESNDYSVRGTFTRNSTTKTIDAYNTQSDREHSSDPYKYHITSTKVIKFLDGTEVGPAMIEDESDIVTLYQVGSDLCDSENVKSIINAVKGQTYTMNGNTFVVLGDDSTVEGKTYKDGEIYNVVVKYQKAADVLKNDIGNIANMVNQGITDPAKKVNTTAVSSVINKLDEGERLTNDEEILIATKIAARLTEMTDDNAAESVYDRAVAQYPSLVEQSGLTETQINALAKDYVKKLNDALSGASLSSLSLFVAGSTVDTTAVKGGVPIAVNPVDASQKQWEKGYDFFVDKLWNRLKEYVSTVTEDDIRNSANVKELYNYLNPKGNGTTAQPGWVEALTSPDSNTATPASSGYGVLSETTYQDQLRKVEEISEAIRQEFVVGKSADTVLSDLKKARDKAETRADLTVDGNVLTDAELEILAKALVKDEPTLYDITDDTKVYQAYRNLVSEDAIRYINRVLDKIDVEMDDDDVSDLADKIVGTYTAKTTITVKECINNSNPT